MSSEVKDKRGSCGALSAIISAVLVVIAMNVLFVAFIFTVLYIILKPPSSNEGLFDLFVATMGVVMLLVSVWPEEHSPVWPYRA
jgi:hypothetical protein